MHKYYPQNEVDPLEILDKLKLEKHITEHPSDIIATMWFERWIEGKQWLVYLLIN